MPNVTTAAERTAYQESDATEARTKLIEDMERREARLMNAAPPAANVYVVMSDTLCISYSMVDGAATSPRVCGSLDASTFSRSEAERWARNTYNGRKTQGRAVTHADAIAEDLQQIRSLLDMLRAAAAAASSIPAPVAANAAPAALTRTLNDYLDKIRVLLKDKPQGTAIRIGFGLAATLLVRGTPVGFEEGLGTESAYDFDSSAWDGDCWEDTTAESTWSPLEKPEFFTLETAPLTGI